MELHTIELLDELESMIENGKKSLIGGRVSVEKNDLLTVIEQLRDILPREMMHANDFYNDSRDVLDAANVQADEIIENADKVFHKILEAS